jgi:hopene-associated glycosyltransferase HpnB
MSNNDGVSGRIVAGVALLAWVWLTLLRGMFWRTDVRLPDAPAPHRWPSVAVVVPARDEAAIVGDTMPTLVAQQYPGPLRVLLVDDNSTDGTGTLVASTWPTVTVVDPGPPEPGWAGKLWALRAGVASAGDAEYLLFTDADIVHPRDSVSRLVAAAEDRGLDLVSLMARLRARSGWERLVVPAFVYFFAMLFPFRWTNRPDPRPDPRRDPRPGARSGSRTAAAAGGCLLVRRTALERAGGVAAIRGAVIDDVALAGALRRTGARTYLALADRGPTAGGRRDGTGTPPGVASIREYATLASLWRMVARSAYAQLRHSPVLLAGTVLGLFLVFLVPPLSTVVGAVTGDAVLLALGAAAWLLMAATYVPMLRYYGQPWAAALALPFTAALYLAMTVDSARMHYRGRGAAWKGRTYPAS